MSALSKIQAIKHVLTPSEVKIANWLLSQTDELRSLSSQKLAMITGVSQSSVVKFAQKLGFKGFPDLKLAIIESQTPDAPQQLLHGDITLDDNYQQMAEKLLANKRNVLELTAKLNNEQSIENAVTTIATANRILIAGMGGSALVAKDFSYKLQKLGKAAFAETDSHVQLAAAATFAEADLVIVVSESGKTAEMAEVAKQASANGCPVISLTCYGINRVSQHANVKLFTATEPDSARLSSILARTSQEFVIDLLFIALTQQGSQGRHLLERSNAAVGVLKQL